MIKVGNLDIGLGVTPSFHIYKARTHIKIQTLQSLTNNLTNDLLFLQCKVYMVGFVIKYTSP
jgi:hypothetical protein